MAQLFAGADLLSKSATSVIFWGKIMQGIIDRGAGFGGMGECCLCDCIVTAVYEEDRPIISYQHGDNPEHRLEVDALDRTGDPSRAFLDWLGRLHAYESGHGAGNMGGPD